MGAKYVIGIDLGTSNCAVAYTEPAAGAGAKVVDFPVPQLVRVVDGFVFLPDNGKSVAVNKLDGKLVRLVEVQEEARDGNRG